MKDLEVSLGYHFHNITFLQNALTHSSYANERWRDSLASNERLEFLGDSILGMVTAEYLYKLLPDRPEGELTRIRADLVCETNLAKVARRLNLGKYLLLGHGEEQGGGRDRASILADATESVLAATYLDGGFQAAADLIHRFILTDIPTDHLRNVDYKTKLQELVQQQKNQIIQYELTGESGPDHAKEFTVVVRLNDRVVGTGVGSSKKRAEQDAARAAIARLFPNED
ncbi:MAG: ribonuclease III [Faecousia sp.]